MSTDYLHLNKAKWGYEYLLIVVDHFTKYVQAFPTKTKSGRETADLSFNKYFLEYGFPKHVIHHQGREFENKLFKRIEQLAGIKSFKTTSYHPMGNRILERTNREVINMLKTLTKNHKLNWNNHIKKLTFAYHNTKNKTTGHSPYFLLFGRDSRLPIDQIFETTWNIHNSKSPSSNELEFNL